MCLLCQWSLHRCQLTPPPTPLAAAVPLAPRFSIAGNKVNWLGWEFYVGNRPTNGPRLWDVRFKGERILYELSAQEWLAGALRDGRGASATPAHVWGTRARLISDTRAVGAYGAASCLTSSLSLPACL